MTSEWLEVRKEQAVHCRAELRRLLQEGLAGRRFEVLMGDVQARFRAAGEGLNWATFAAWFEGTAFPASTARQGLLADEVGGPSGEAIRALRWPFAHLNGNRHGGPPS